MYTEDVYHDDDGFYYLDACVDYEGVTIEKRRYVNSVSIKRAGGFHVLYCEQTGNKLHRRNEHMLMHSLSKFINEQRAVLAKRSNG